MHLFLFLIYFTFCALVYIYNIFYISLFRSKPSKWNLQPSPSFSFSLLSSFYPSFSLFSLSVTLFLSLNFVGILSLKLLIYLLVSFLSRKNSVVEGCWFFRSDGDKEGSSSQEGQDFCLFLLFEFCRSGSQKIIDFCKLFRSESWSIVSFQIWYCITRFLVLNLFFTKHRGVLHKWSY